MDMLGSGGGLLLAALGIGFVIFIHELGHFLFAKWAGVKVHTFSIGFGPVIARRSIGETDYQLSLLPFGGYVQMQEESDDSGRAMNDVSAWWQAAILFAGVLFNLVSSFLILLCLAWYGMPHSPAVVGDVEAVIRSEDGTHISSPARELGLQPGDRILSYNGVTVHNYMQLASMTATGGGEAVHLRVRRGDEELVLPADEQTIKPLYDSRFGMPRLGVGPARTNRVDTWIQPPEGAEPGARIVAVDGNDTRDALAYELHNLLAPKVGEAVTLTLMQDGDEHQVTGTYLGDPGSAAHAAVGLPVTLVSVLEDSAAANAGLQPGDVVATVDGRPVASMASFIAAVRKAGTERPVELQLMRRSSADHETVTASLTARWDPVMRRPLIGVTLSPINEGVLPLLPAVPGDSPLAAAGLETGDALLAQRILDQLDEASDEQDGARLLQPMQVQYLRGGQVLRLPLDEAAMEVLLAVAEPSIFAKFLGAETPEPLADHLQAHRVNARDATDERVELVLDAWPLPASGTVAAANALERDRSLVRLQADWPESLRSALGQLQKDDWIVAVRRIGDSGGELEILRGCPDGRPRLTEIRPHAEGFSLAFGIEEVPYQMEHWYDGFGLATWYSVDMVVRTARVVGLFFTDEQEGGISASKSLHGPVGIFSEMKGRLEQFGFASFLKFVALLGLNLFLINLLPVPIADGGRLMILGVEQLIRRPLPAVIINGLNYLSFFAIVALMIFVLGADILRVLGRH